MIDYSYFSIQNPWWEDPDAISRDQKIVEFDGLPFKYYPKNILEAKLLPGDVNIITGPRQTGKSTAVKLYIRKLLEKKFSPQSILFFNCDALSDSKEVIYLVMEFNKMAGENLKAIFLDEITSVANWPQAIKWLADAGLLNNTAVFLTGSSSISFKKSGEFLPGRRGKGKDFINLPVNFKEYLSLKKIEYKKIDSKMLSKVEKPFEDFLLSGGFLRNINYGVTQENFQLYLATLRSELFKAGRKEDFLREVVRKILSSLSSQTSYTNVAEEAELGSKNTAIEYLSFLSDAFFLKEVKAYDPHQKRVILKKNKKFYAADPFIIWLFSSFVSGGENGLQWVDFYNASDQKGKVIENFIATELNKSGAEFYFSQNSRELDFYLPKEKIAMEVKYKDKITSEDLKSLEVAPNNFKKILVSKDTLEIRGNITIIPAALVVISDFWPK